MTSNASSPKQVSTYLSESLGTTFAQFAQLLHEADFSTGCTSPCSLHPTSKSCIKDNAAVNIRCALTAFNATEVASPITLALVALSTAKAAISSGFAHKLHRP
ncbi:hypothetical protein CDAR_49461 [Caerostris darwini]|uniref:Antifreeze protein n=1 Tax=Caerostris darwini TaxID=1538125 RepID=A0AAV4QB29_9ARAC|nr:hypothetical protein CDAR_49461 [Caerostris darwini]